MNSDDRTLLEGWKTGHDPECLNRLIRKYAGFVHAAALRITQNPTDADDVAQECIITLARKPPAGTAPLGAWLHRVATRRAIDHRRMEGRRRAREDKWAAQETPAGNATPTEALQRTIDAAIDALPDIQRTAIVAHFIEGQTHEQIAEAAGVSRPAVTQRIQHGLESLRKALAFEGEALDETTLAGLVKPTRNSAAMVALFYKLESVHERLGAPAAPSGSITGRRGKWLTNSGLSKVFAVALLAAIVGFGVFQYYGTPRVASTAPSVAITEEPQEPPNAPAWAAEEPALQPEPAPLSETAPAIEAPGTIAPVTPPSIVGRVFDVSSQRGLSGVIVELAGPISTGGIDGAPAHVTTTDGNGRYTVTKLAAGTYSVGLRDVPGYPSTNAGRARRGVALGNNESDPVRVDFGLEQSGTLAGKLSVNGEPRANMTVLLDSAPQLDVTEVTSDARGNYRVEGLGSYKGSLRVRGRVSGTLRATPYVTAEVKPGLVTQADFDFLAGSASIEGNVYLHKRDGEVLPVSGKVVVTYAYVDGNDYNVENMDLPTDADGHYLVKGLWGGRVTVGLYPSIPGVHRHRYTFELGDGEKAQQDFHFHETRIDVTIRQMPKDKELDVWLVAIPGHVDRVEGTGAAQRDFVESQQRCVGSVRPNADGSGSGSLGGLPPGDYTILASGILGSHTLINHAAGEEFYRRRRTVRTYTTLPENTDRIAIEMTFPDEP